VHSGFHFASEKKLNAFTATAQRVMVLAHRVVGDFTQPRLEGVRRQLFRTSPGDALNLCGEDITASEYTALLAQIFEGIEVFRSAMALCRSWLYAAEEAGFELQIGCDQNVPHQQNLASHRLAVIILHRITGRL
jgi:hypothetical protein